MLIRNYNIQNVIHWFDKFIGERPYRCNVCGHSFNRSSSYTRHCKLHTGEKPHECKVCNKRFIEKYDLTKHSKKHDKDNKKL